MYVKLHLWYMQNHCRCLRFQGPGHLHPRSGCLCLCYMPLRSGNLWWQIRSFQAWLYRIAHVQHKTTTGTRDDRLFLSGFDVLVASCVWGRDSQETNISSNFSRHWMSLDILTGMSICVYEHAHRNTCSHSHTHAFRPPIMFTNLCTHTHTCTYPPTYMPTYTPLTQTYTYHTHLYH